MRRSVRQSFCIIRGIYFSMCNLSEHSEWPTFVRKMSDIHWPEPKIRGWQCAPSGVPPKCCASKAPKIEITPILGMFPARPAST
jgi:hypothetical protein